MRRTSGAVHAGRISTCDSTVLQQSFVRSVPPQCYNQGSHSALSLDAAWHCSGWAQYCTMLSRSGSG